MLRNFHTAVQLYAVHTDVDRHFVKCMGSRCVDTCTIDWPGEGGHKHRNLFLSDSSVVRDPVFRHH